MKQPNFGPYVNPTTKPENPRKAECSIIPLGLVLEYATPKESRQIALYARSAWLRKGFRLHDIVCRADDIPCDLECQETDVVETATGKFLPMEAIVVALYSSGRVSRSIFEFLIDLTKQAPISAGSTVHPPRDRDHLLIPELEQAGFCVRTVIPDGEDTFFDIGWRPTPDDVPTHVCICSFSVAHPKESRWQAPSRIGLSQLLFSEFRSKAPELPWDAIAPRERHSVLTDPDRI